MSAYVICFFRDPPMRLGHVLIFNVVLHRCVKCVGVVISVEREVRGVVSVCNSTWLVGLQYEANQFCGCFCFRKNRHRGLYPSRKMVFVCSNGLGRSSEKRIVEGD